MHMFILPFWLKVYTLILTHHHPNSSWVGVVPNCWASGFVLSNTVYRAVACKCACNYLRLECVLFACAWSALCVWSALCRPNGNLGSVASCCLPWSGCAALVGCFFRFALTPLLTWSAALLCDVDHVIYAFPTCTHIIYTQNYPNIIRSIINPRYYYGIDMRGNPLRIHTSIKDLSFQVRLVARARELLGWHPPHHNTYHNPHNNSC